MPRSRVLAGFLFTLAASCLAQEHQHGSGEKLGTVHYDTSCNEAAQKEFDRAVALLHSFQFSRAIEGFKSALREDSTCGIAYWGIALSDWSNPFAAGMKDKSQLQAGRENAEHGKSVGAKTERERAYVAAVAKLYSDYESTAQGARLIAYRDSMGELATKYPADHEAQIFYALSITAAEDLSDKTYAGRLKAGAILEKLFAEEPEHPGLAHYIIHTYDVPALAGRALVAARRYSEIAPDAPHALHMPSHTFTRTGYWQESIDSNLAAAAASRREGQTAEELHSSDYEIYAYLQTGQDGAARRVLDSLPEIASRFDPRAVNTGAAVPSAGYFALAAIPARYSLERRDWKQAAQLPVRETPFPYTEAMTWFARGLGAARLGQAPAANESAAAPGQIRERLLKSGESYCARQVEIQEVAVEAWAALAAGKKEEALRQMKLAAEMEDGTEKSAVTPGPLAPARELLGEMLLEMNDPKQALEQFEATLKREPGRFRALYGAAHAAQLGGSRETSQEYFRELLKVCVHADKPGRSEVTEASSPYRSFAGDFERVADSTNGLPMTERVKVFRSTFDKLYPGLYADADESRLEGRIEKALTEFPSIRSTYEQVERKFPEALASSMKEFREAFPGFTPPMPIYLIHSLGTRDGGTDLVAGRMVMLFGADEIAQFHWDESLQPFIVHELFHIEHIQHFADCDQLWCSLWQEGLATYAASALTPNASDHQLILDVPHPIREDTDAHWPEALCWTAEHFDSSNPSEVSAAFTGGPKPSTFSGDGRLTPLPSRFGYYVGLRVATQAVKTRSLSELDRLDDQAARPIVARALAELMQASHLSCPLPAKEGSITHHAPRTP